MGRWCETIRLINLWRLGSDSSLHIFLDFFLNANDSHSGFLLLNENDSHSRLERFSAPKCQTEVPNWKYPAPKCETEVLKCSLRAAAATFVPFYAKSSYPQVIPKRRCSDSEYLLSILDHKNPLSRVWVIFLERGQLLLYLLFQVNLTRRFWNPTFVQLNAPLLL